MCAALVVADFMRKGQGVDAAGAGHSPGHVATRFQVSSATDVCAASKHSHHISAKLKGTAKQQASRTSSQDKEADVLSNRSKRGELLSTSVAAERHWNASLTSGILLYMAVDVKSL
jgi:hypothetical protein